MHPEQPDYTPDVIRKKIAEYNGTRSCAANDNHGAITQSDEDILLGNPALAKAIFNGIGFDFINKSRITIEELNNSPAELWELLRSTCMQEAVTEKLITMRDLHVLAAPKLKHLSVLFRLGMMEEAAEVLHMTDDRAAMLVDLSKRVLSRECLGL